MIDDQGAGGSSKSSDTKPGTQRRHASSLPETLLPHLYDSPRDSGSQIIAPLMVPDLPNGPIRSSSPNRVQSLPIRSQILDQSLESHRHSYSHIPPLRTLQPPRLSPRHTGPSPGVEDVFDGDVGVLLQPDMPIRPLGDPYVPLRRSPGFYQVQRRSGTEARAIDTSRGERTQTQPRDHRIGLEQGRSDGPLRDPQRQVERFPPHPIRESRPPITYPINPFEEQQRLQRQRLQVHHQPQPQQPQRFRQLLSGPGYQGSTGTSSSSQAASTSQSRTIWSFSSELYSEGKSEVEPLRQGSLAAEHPAIGAQGAVPGRKKAQRSSAVKKEPGAPTVGGGSTSTSTGTTTSTRKRPSSKVSVACNFCRGRKLRCDGGKPCSTCSGRRIGCVYPLGGPRRRGPGKAPKKTRAEASRQRQQQRQQQQAQQQPPDHSQMSINAASPVSSGPSPITAVPPPGIFGGGGPLTPVGGTTPGPRFPSHSPGASTPEVETGPQPSRRPLSGSSVDEPERKRSRIRELGEEEEH